MIDNPSQDQAPIDLATTDEPEAPQRRSGVRTIHARVELAGGEFVEVTARNPDMVRWDMTRARHNWPDSKAAPMLWLTFVTWAAMRRDNLTACDFETFRDSLCLDITTLDDDDDADVDPTRKGHDGA